MRQGERLGRQIASAPCSASAIKSVYCKKILKYHLMLFDLYDCEILRLKVGEDRRSDWGGGVKTENA